MRYISLLNHVPLKKKQTFPIDVPYEEGVRSFVLQRLAFGNGSLLALFGAISSLKFNFFFVLLIVGIEVTFWLTVAKGERSFEKLMGSKSKTLGFFSLLKDFSKFGSASRFCWEATCSTVTTLSISCFTCSSKEFVSGISDMSSKSGISRSRILFAMQMHKII